MDRAAGLLKGFRQKFKVSRPAVGDAVRRWASETLEQRVLMSAAASPSFDAVFIKNQGQWSDPAVKYAYQTSTANILMTDLGPVFQVFGQSNGNQNVSQFLVQFEGANNSTATGLDPTKAKFNFLVGDKSDWRTGVSGYNEIAYKGIYDGIDLYATGNKGNLKYEFHVAPGADPSQVKVHYSGIQGLSIDKDGNLHIKTATGELVDDAPVVYQMINGQRVIVKSQFKLLDNNTYTFQLNGKYDPTKELILDPDVSWLAYLGGTSAEVGNGVARDSAGNIYVTGSTSSTDFPTIGPLSGIQGTIPIAPGGGQDTDIFVAKFDSTGVMQWGTFLGGSGADAGQELVTDNSGNLYVTGQTAGNWTGQLFPGQTDSFGGTDAFLAGFNTATGALEFSGFIGGSGTDTGSAIDVDSSGNVYVGGQTASTNFGTVNPFQNARSGQSDGFLVKFDPISRQFDWASYFGGNGTDSINDLSVDATGNIDVVGTTNSTTGLATDGAFQTTLGGNTDAWVGSVTEIGGIPQVNWATYVGGAGADVGNGIAVRKDAIANSNSDIWITGNTAANSTDFPVTNTPPNGRKGNNTDAFLTAIKSDGSALDLQNGVSILIDTSQADVGNAVAMDTSGDIAVVGNTAGTPGNGYIGLPVHNAIPGVGFSPNGGTNDGWIYYIAKNVTDSFVSYFGSAGTDQLNNVLVDPSGGMVAVGTTGSTDLPQGPATTGLQSTAIGGNDAFIVRIAPNDAAKLPLAPSNLSANAISMTQIKLTWNDNATNETGYEIWRGTTRHNLVPVHVGLAANTRTFIDSGLDPETTYFYQVYAVNLAAKTPSTNVASAKTQTADMVAPSGLTATVVSAKQINLKWTDNSSNDTGFEIWRQNTALGDFAQVATVGAGTTTYQDKDPALLPNTEYSYQVRAFNVFEESDFSNAAIVTTPSANFIVAPTNLTVTALQNPDGNLLSWTDNSDNEDHFDVERADAGSGNFTVIGSTASLSNAHTFVDSNIVAGQFYTYRVRAINGADTSAYSNLATTDFGQALAAPGRLDAVAMSNTSIQLVWVNHAIIQTGFVIQRAINAPSGWITIKTTGPNATSFLATKLVPNKRYYFRVFATDGTDFSASSNQANDITFPVSTLTAPAAPSKLKATAQGSNAVQLTWRDNSIDETGFKVYRSLSSDGPFTQVGTVGVNGHSFTDTTKVKAGMTYFYEVRSWNGRFKSLASNVAQVTTAAPARKPKVALAVAPTASSSVFSTKQVAGSNLVQVLDLL